jgi:uncharacterized membrane protein
MPSKESYQMLALFFYHAEVITHAYECDSRVAAVRTVVILFIAWGIVLVSGEIRETKNAAKNNLLFLGLSGLATGLSWIFYFKALQTGDVSKVAPIDKLSVAIAWTCVFDIKITYG